MKPKQILLQSTDTNMPIMCYSKYCHNTGSDNVMSRSLVTPTVYFANSDKTANVRY